MAKPEKRSRSPSHGSLIEDYCMIGGSSAGFLARGRSIDVDWLSEEYDHSAQRLAGKFPHGAFGYRAALFCVRYAWIMASSAGGQNAMPQRPPEECNSSGLKCLLTDICSKSFTALFLLNVLP